MAQKHIAEVKAGNTAATSAPEDGRALLFHHLVNSEMLESELSVDRLSQEAQILFGAGTTSTARTLDFISYYIISDKRVRSALQNDLKEVMSGYPKDIPSWAQLEKLPYLHAVVKEGLR